jgi:hypothetical protein
MKCHPAVAPGWPILTMTIELHVRSIKRHLTNAQSTIDRDKQKLEMQFARMFFERLRYEYSKLPDAQVKAVHPEAYHLLQSGLR